MSRVRRVPFAVASPGTIRLDRRSGPREVVVRLRQANERMGQRKSRNDNDLQASERLKRSQTQKPRLALKHCRNHLQQPTPVLWPLRKK